MKIIEQYQDKIIQISITQYYHDGVKHYYPEIHGLSISGKLYQLKDSGWEIITSSPATKE